MQNAGLVLVVVLVEGTHQSARQKYDEASHLILSHFSRFDQFEGSKGDDDCRGAVCRDSSALSPYFEPLLSSKASKRRFSVTKY